MIDKKKTWFKTFFSERIQAMIECCNDATWNDAIFTTKLEYLKNARKLNPLINSENVLPTTLELVDICVPQKGTMDKAAFDQTKEDLKTGSRNFICFIFLVRIQGRCQSQSKNRRRIL